MAHIVFSVSSKLLTKSSRFFIQDPWREAEMISNSDNPCLSKAIVSENSGL
jgi:hypothetical protein